MCNLFSVLATPLETCVKTSNKKTILRISIFTLLHKMYDIPVAKMLPNVNIKHLMFELGSTQHSVAKHTLVVIL